MLTPSLDTIRLFLHILGASIWVGGQFVLAGVVPVARRLGPEATKAVANGFARVAWPAYALTVFTGMWNLFKVDTATATTAYHATLGVKILLAIAAGFAAFWHSRTSHRPTLAATGALGALFSVTALFFGILLTNHG